MPGRIPQGRFSESAKFPVALSEVARRNRAFKPVLNGPRNGILGSRLAFKR